MTLPDAGGADKRITEPVAFEDFRELGRESRHRGAFK